MTCELCHLTVEPIYRNDKFTVIMAEDAAYPGFCRVIWHEHVKEMSDLEPADRLLINEAVWQVEVAMRDVMAPDKVNVASLGNVVPHLHWHIIPRYTDDAHFPNPVWAEAVRTTEEDILEQRRTLLPHLRAAIAHRFGE